MNQLKPSPANSSPLTPVGFLERAATAYGDSTSIIYGTTTYTWSETHRRCVKLASSLSSLGIQRGQVISVLAPNTPAMYELQFAVPMSGAVLSNLNTRLDARMVSVLLRHSESKLLFVDCSSRSLALDAIALLSNTNPPILVLINDDDVSMTSGSVGLGFDWDYEDLVGRGNGDFKSVSPKSEYDPIVLNYTSGTTSSPKGVVHSHRGIFIMAVDSLIDWAVPKQPVYLWTLPIFHANGWTYPWGIAAVGGTNVCLRKVDAPSIYRLIKSHGVTHMCCAPVVLSMLSNYPGPEPLEKPVQIMTAGAPPPAPVLLRAESLGFAVSHGYGLTETAGVVVTCAWKPKWNRLPATDRARLRSRQGVRTVGLTEIDVVDRVSGRSVARDGLTVGEIVFKGGSVMLGYLKDPIGTQKCLKEDGWFHTGDVGVIHPDGYLEIKDRSKDIIITGGENVSSVEVESVLYTNPAVKEAAVVARPDEFWGETPCAFVSLKVDSGQPSEKEIMDFCRERLPHFMVPKTVAFRDELPKTATGKIQKSALRELARDMGSLG